MAKLYSLSLVHYLKKFAERKSEDKNLAENALFELQEIFLATHLSCRETMKQRVYYRKKRLENALIDILANGSDTFARFAERLLNQFKKLFFFTKHEEVECINNIAERSLRHIVLWRKTSYGTQSTERESVHGKNRLYLDDFKEARKRGVFLFLPSISINIPSTGYSPYDLRRPN